MRCPRCGFNQRDAPACARCGAAVAAAVPLASASASTPAAEAAGVAPRHPWLTIWLRPRDTVRALVAFDPRHGVLLLAALGGIGEALDRASLRDMGDRIAVSWILLAGLLLGPLGGLVSLWVGGALLERTGHILGGHAPALHVRTALAWGSVPVVASLPLWGPKLLLFGAEMFTSETPQLEADPLLVISLLALAGLELALGAWAMVLVLKGVGEVHGFSAWRALGAVALAALLVVALVVLAAVAIALPLFLLFR